MFWWWKKRNSMHFVVFIALFYFTQWLKLNTFSLIPCLPGLGLCLSPPRTAFLTSLFFFLSPPAGRWPVWPGDELHHPGTREHRVHGGAVGQVWAHLSGRGLEHLHRHPQEERPQPAGVHWCGAHPAGAPAYIHHGQHDCRYWEQYHVEKKNLYFLYIGDVGVSIF